MDMKVVNVNESNSIWLFDYPTDLLVQAARDEEVRSFESEKLYELKPTVKPLKRVADLVATNIKRDFDCDCDAVQAVVVPKPGESMVVRMSVKITYMPQGYLVQPIRAYVEKLLADLKSCFDSDSERLEATRDRITTSIKSALRQCASGQESVIIPLDLPSGDSVEITIPPQPPIEKNVPEKFTGHVWCVNDKARNCRVQVKSSSAKEKNLFLHFKSSCRNLLLESQLREAKLRFEINPYDQKHDLDGVIVAVVADEPELDL